MHRLFQTLWHISLHWTFFESLAIWITAVSKSLKLQYQVLLLAFCHLLITFSLQIYQGKSMFIKQLTYFVTSSTNYTEEEDFYVSHVRSQFTYYSTIQRLHLIKRYHHDWVNIWLSKFSNEKDFILNDYDTIYCIAWKFQAK